MIFSKGNLLACEVSAVDKLIPALGYVCFTREGVSVAANGKSVLIVGPVQPAVAQSVPIENKAKIDKSEFCISLDTCKEIARAMPKDNLFKGLLEHVDISETGEFRLTDGARSRTVQAKVYMREWIQWRTIAQRMHEEKYLCRVVVNRKRLLKLLDVLDTVCADAGDESPVYMQINADGTMILRAVNQRTGQRAAGIMTAYKGGEGQWLTNENWENQLLKNNSNENPPPPPSPAVAPKKWLNRLVRSGE